MTSSHPEDREYADDELGFSSHLSDVIHGNHSTSPDDLITANANQMPGLTFLAADTCTPTDASKISQAQMAELYRGGSKLDSGSDTDDIQVTFSDGPAEQGS